MTASPLRIRLDEIAEAMDSSHDHAWTLDLDTGEVSPEPSDLFEGDLDDEDGDEEGEAAPRTESIPTIGSLAAHALRVRFADSVRDEELRFRLHDALRGRGAFSRFRDMIEDDADARDEFRAFRAAELEGDARRWLDGLGIPWEAVAAPQSSPPSPAPTPAPADDDIGLVEVLLLGGQVELISGYVRRFAPTPARDLARGLFKRLAREVCELQGIPWRTRWIAGQDELEVGRFKLAVHDDGVSLDVHMTPEQWRRFAR